MPGQGPIPNGNPARSPKNNTGKTQKERIGSQKGIDENHLKTHVFRIFAALICRKGDVVLRPKSRLVCCMRTNSTSCSSSLSRFLAGCERFRKECRTAKKPFGWASILSNNFTFGSSFGDNASPRFAPSPTRSPPHADSSTHNPAPSGYHGAESCTRG